MTVRTQQTESEYAKYGLSTLSQVPLPSQRVTLLSKLAKTSQGSPTWRARKLAEARDLFALETIAARLFIVALDLTTELLAIVRMQVTTPCLPAGGELVVAGQVYLALRYPEEILHGPLPGYALVQIPTPRRVWHPNVSAEPPQHLCLGANVPKGFPLREAVLGSYTALTLQSITLDPTDPAGIMNQDALAYWNDHQQRIPLSRAAFLDDPGTQPAVEAQPKGEAQSARKTQPAGKPQGTGGAS